MLTLSQILVLHRRNHGNDHLQKTPEQLKQRTLFEVMEKMVSSMMKREYVPLEQNNEMIMAYIYAERIKREIHSASEENNMQSERTQVLSDKINKTCVRERISRHLQFIKSVKSTSDQNMSNSVIKDNINGNINISSCVSEIKCDNITTGERTKHTVLSNRRHRCPPIPTTLSKFIYFFINQLQFSLENSL